MIKLKKNIEVEPFFNTHMTYHYDRSLVKTRLSRTKEWDFYQFLKGDFIVQATIGHASLFSSFDSTIFNLKTGEKYRSARLELVRKGDPIYEANPEVDHTLLVDRKNFYLKIELKDGIRHIVHKSKTFDLDLEIKNDYEHDKMVILTPFYEGDKYFYLNYKENYYDVKGRLLINDKEYNFDGATGLLDCGRGYFPYKHEWYWGSASLILDNGDKLGWNIGWGFGNLVNTENIFFLNGKGYKLGVLKTNIVNGNVKAPMKLDDENGIFHIELTPLHNNISDTKVLWINNHCDQMFSITKGYVIADDKKIEFENKISFLEHAINKW